MLSASVAGLRLGRLEVFTNNQGDDLPSQQLTITNHSIPGPVLSDPQEKPYLCATEMSKLPDGSSLGSPLDADCSARMVVNYVYKAVPAADAGPRPAKPVLKPLPSLSSLPADVAWTVTSTGQKVPYVVRIETGTINRAIYQIAILHDPSTEPDPGPLGSPKGWNRRLIYTFGGGCPGGWYKQGLTVGLSGGIVDDATMGKGYAEASATLNHFGNNCSDVIAAETMMMVKERFIGGLRQAAVHDGPGWFRRIVPAGPDRQHLSGLLDGIMPSSTFPMFCRRFKC